MAPPGTPVSGSERGFVRPVIVAGHRGDRGRPPASARFESDQVSPPRWVLVTLAVAHRIDGPISSMRSSTTDRLSPSWVSQVRCSSEPVTMTRIPLVSDSATFSAMSRQHVPEKKLVSSCHSSLRSR